MVADWAIWNLLAGPSPRDRGRHGRVRRGRLREESAPVACGHVVACAASVMRQAAGGTTEGQDSMSQITGDLKALVREVPDFPKPGILFYDITTLLADPAGLRRLVDSLGEHYEADDVDIVVGMEARGFILAPMLAYRLGAGFVPVRKPNKLPSHTVSVEYDLEYGSDSLHVHSDAIQPGMRVLICDDLLATGGTAAATVSLIRQLGGEVVGAAFAIELTFLGGRTALPGIDVHSVLAYDS